MQGSGFNLILMIHKGNPGMIRTGDFPGNRVFRNAERESVSVGRLNENGVYYESTI